MTRAYTQSSRAALTFVLILATGVSSCTSSEDSASPQSGGSGGDQAVAGASRSASAGRDNEQTGRAAQASTAMNAGSGGTSAAGAPTAGSPNMSTAPAMDDGAVTWSNIYAFDFRSCQVSNCHGKGTAGVVMTNKDAAWDSLVNQPASPTNMCSQLGKQRVVPGKPDESLLFLKLDGDSAPCGQQMPPGGQLSRKARERVRAWIEMGAEKD